MGGKSETRRVAKRTVAPSGSIKNAAFRQGEKNERDEVDAALDVFDMTPEEFAAFEMESELTRNPSESLDEAVLHETGLGGEKPPVEKDVAVPPSAAKAEMSNAETSSNAGEPKEQEQPTGRAAPKDLDQIYNERIAAALAEFDNPWTPPLSKDVLDAAPKNAEPTANMAKPDSVASEVADKNTKGVKSDDVLATWTRNTADGSTRVNFQLLAGERGGYKEQFDKDIMEDTVVFSGSAEHAGLKKLFKRGKMTVAEAQKELEKLAKGHDKDVSSLAKELLENVVNPRRLFAQKHRREILEATGGNRQRTRAIELGHLEARRQAEMATSLYGDMKDEGIKQLYGKEYDRKAYDLVGGAQGLFLGQEIKSPRDVGLLAQGLSNKQQETGRFIIVKNGKVVATKAFSHGVNSLTSLASVSEKAYKKIEKKYSDPKSKHYEADSAERKKKIHADLMSEHYKQHEESVGNFLAGQMQHLGTLDLAANPSDGIYYIHNHPGGKVAESNCENDPPATENMIRTMQKRLKEAGQGSNPNLMKALRAHIIVDHNEYSQIVPGYDEQTGELLDVGNAEYEKKLDPAEVGAMYKRLSGEDLAQLQQGKERGDEAIIAMRQKELAAARAKKPTGTLGLGSVEIPLAREYWNQQMAKLGMHQKHSGTSVLLFYRDINGEVVGVEEVPGELLESKDKALVKGMRERSRLYGADNVVTCSQGEVLTPELEGALDEMHENGDIKDHILIGGVGAKLALRRKEGDTILDNKDVWQLQRKYSEQHD